MAQEATVARETSARPLNATSSVGGQGTARVTKKTVDAVLASLNDDESNEKYTEGLSYNRGTATAYTSEKGYGNRPSYTEEYTKAPDRSALGWRWTDRDAYAAAVFRHFERKGIKLKKLVHHGQYD